MRVYLHLLILWPHAEAEAEAEAQRRSTLQLITFVDSHENSCIFSALLRPLWAVHIK